MPDKKRKPRRSYAELAAEAEAKVRYEEAKLKALAIKQRREFLSTYRSARQDRTTRDWQPASTSADSAILADSKRLIARSRQMGRDDSNAKSVKHAYLRNVISTGILPQSTAETEDGQPLTDYRKKTNRAFKRWAKNRKLVDIEGKRTFVMIERWIMRELVDTGEAIIIHSYRPTPQGVGYTLQPVESEMLDTNKLSHPVDSENTNDVRGGVEVDDLGRAVAYWIYPRHPHDVRGLNRPSPLSLDSVRVPASRVSHVFDPERVRQTRGVTMTHAVLGKMRDLAVYDDSQLLAARQEACMGLIITRKSGSPEVLGLNQPTGEDGQQRNDTDGNKELAMQPLMVTELEEDESVTGFTPTRPGTMYDQYAKRQQRMIGSGVDMSYAQLALDFTEGNFSSQKQTGQEDRKGWAMWQGLIFDLFVSECFANFQRWAILEGSLEPQMGVPDDLLYASSMLPPEWEPPDEKDYAEGVEKMLALDLTTHDRELGRLGRTDMLAETPQADPAQPVVEPEVPVIEPEVTVDDQQPADVIGKITPEEETAENLVGGEKLNGAQIIAAKELVTDLIAGILPPEAVIELLVAVGLEQVKAESIVQAAQNFETTNVPTPTPAAVVPTPPANVAG